MAAFEKEKLLIAYIIWYMLNKIELPSNNQLALCCIHTNNQPFDVSRITARLELLIIKAVLIFSTGKIQQIKEKHLSFANSDWFLILVLHFFHKNYKLLPFQEC